MISHRPIHGLIFLFKWIQDDELSGSIVQDSRLDKIFFAKQVSKIIIVGKDKRIEKRFYIFYNSKTINIFFDM